MSVRLRSSYPLAQKESYAPDDFVDTTLSFAGEDIVPGTFRISGKLMVSAAVITANPDTGYTTPYHLDLHIDPHAGIHAAFRQISTNIRKISVLENLDNYPRHAKMELSTTTCDSTLGAETASAMELRSGSTAISHGLIRGLGSDLGASGINNGTQASAPLSAVIDLTAAGGKARAVPFCFAPICAMNGFSNPLSFDKAGECNVRLRLAPVREFIFGNLAVRPDYRIFDLQFHIQTMVSQGLGSPQSFTVYQSVRQMLQSTQSNLITAIAGLCDSVKMSFIAESHEQGLDVNYLACEAPSSIPQGGPNGAPDTVVRSGYGFERLHFSLNDVDTGLTSFELRSREEILLNYLRVFQLDQPSKFPYILSELQASFSSDLYGVGLNWGSFIDFTRSKFAVELRSQGIANTVSYANGVLFDRYVCYMFFRTMVTL